MTAAGGGFRIDASVKRSDDLVRIAAAAASGGGIVTFSGLGTRTVADLAMIAASGKGHVVMED